MLSISHLYCRLYSLHHTIVSWLIVKSFATAGKRNGNIPNRSFFSADTQARTGTQTSYVKLNIINSWLTKLIEFHWILMSFLSSLWHLFSSKILNWQHIVIICWLYCIADFEKFGESCFRSQSPSSIDKHSQKPSPRVNKQVRERRVV